MRLRLQPFSFTLLLHSHKACSEETACCHGTTIATLLISCCWDLLRWRKYFGIGVMPFTVEGFDIDHAADVCHGVFDTASPGPLPIWSDCIANP
jgi:hypothetical protein